MNNKSKQKRLMIIGASWEQVPLIKTAKNMGYYILATSPDKDSEGLDLADEKAIVDPRDLTQLLKIAKSYSPDGITSDECDYSNYASVYVSIRLGLPHNGLAGAQNTTNKLWMRQKCQKVHILQPRFFSCRTIEDSIRAVDLIGWPVIVKPVDNRGAFGINVAKTHAELEFSFLDALINSHSRDVIVEAYIEGTHITVDGCVDQDGNHHNLAIASKDVTPGEKPIIIQVDYPAKISNESADYVMSVNNQVIDALEITGGLTHSEYILDKKGRCFLVETANRGGGVLTSAYIVPEISGVDLSKLLVNNSVGRKFSINKNLYKGNVILKFFVFNPGQILEIRGLEEVEKMKGVKYLRLSINPGDKLLKPQSGADRHGFVILKADSADVLKVLYKKIINTIQIVYRND
jgi:biotin carboxylase